MLVISKLLSLLNIEKELKPPQKTSTYKQYHMSVNIVFGL